MLYVFNTKHATKIPFVYSQKRNCAASSPDFHTHAPLRVIYIFPGSVHIFSFSRIDRQVVGIQNANIHMNVEIGT
jgi:hypothetical protein